MRKVLLGLLAGAALFSGQALAVTAWPAAPAITASSGDVAASTATATLCSANIGPVDSYRT
jgi:hypothetical protein